MQGSDFVGHLPSQPFWSLDGSQIYFHWNRDSLPDEEMHVFDLREEKYRRLSLEESHRVVPGSRVKANKADLYTYENNGDIFLTGTNIGKQIQITNTMAREYAPSFSGDDKSIIYRSGSNLFRWSIENGSTEQLTNFVPGSDKDPKDSPQRSWLERDQLQYFEILRERSADKKYKELTANFLKQNQPLEIRTKELKVDQVVSGPAMNYIYYRLREDPKAAKTIVPDYVTEGGYTKDLDARPKVGDLQPRYESWIYDRERDTTFPIGTATIPGIYDKPQFLKEYHAPGVEWVDTFVEQRKVIILDPIFNSEGGRAVVVVRSEDNKDRWIMSLDLQQGTLSLIDRQHDDAWVGGPGISGWNRERGNIGFVSPDVLWFQSEISGYSHIYLFDFKEQKKTTLTKGAFEILDASLSEDGSKFYVQASKENAFENHFYHISVETGTWSRITEREGSNVVLKSPDETLLAVLFSYSNKPTELFWMENTPGAEMHQITSSTRLEFQAYDWRDPEIIHFKARDGVMVPARIYEPGKGRGNGAAVIFVHGAGYLHNVHKWWSSYFREYMFHNLLADQGYVVLDVDYRGSAGYGRDWRTGIYRFMGGKDLDDQVDAVQYLVNQKKIDADRVGIYGGSYGGFITLMALCTSPGTFNCGAALRSVTDWAHYNHEYTSNILNTPSEDSISYRRSSPIYHAQNLEGKLIMLHGVVDANVHFQDVVRMSQRFIEAKKEDWELAVFPMEGHGFIEPSCWHDEYRRILNLFEENLGE